MPAPLVSVVTPVRNTAEYLEECIQSVRAQSYANWEYVIADNGSNDGSLEIARRFASIDARIRVIDHAAVLPQVPNYNRALRYADAGAAYVKVVEADNAIDRHCLERMVEVAESDKAIGVVSSYNSTERCLRFLGLPARVTVFDGREIGRRQLAGDIYVMGAPTTVMFRSCLIRGRDSFFNETHVVAEDQSACFDALRTTRFGFVHQNLAFVRSENQSILSRLKGFDAQYLDRVVLFDRHSHDFFLGDERAEIERNLLRTYYQRLAFGHLAGQGEDFWRFHRAGLQSTGRRLEPGRLRAAIVRERIRRLLRC